MAVNAQVTGQNRCHHSFTDPQKHCVDSSDRGGLYSVLQAAQSVLIALFQLNTPEFSMLLAALPKTFQDGATKLLQNHLKNTGNVAQVRLTHRAHSIVLGVLLIDITTILCNRLPQAPMGSPLTRHTPRSPASWSSPVTSPTNTSQNTPSPR